MSDSPAHPSATGAAEVVIDAPALPPAEAAPTDAWQREILERAAGLGSVPSHGPGRVLRVKLGYNPNSSSIGSVVSILMWSAAFGAVAMNVFAALIREQAGALQPVDANVSDDGAPERGAEGRVEERT